MENRWETITDLHILLTLVASWEWKVKSVKKIAQVTERRQAIWELSKRPVQTRAGSKKTEQKERVKKQREKAWAELQEKREEKRQQTRERVRKYRQRKLAASVQEQATEAAMNLFYSMIGYFRS